MTAKRFTLDTNVYDFLVAEPARAALARDATARGLVEFLSTHIESDEISRIPDASKREEIAKVPRTTIPTWGFVLDVSRLDMARLGPAEPIEAIRNGSLKKTNDALIATTALFEGSVLVTDDRRLRNFARRQGVEVWTPKDLLAYLEAAPTS